jgi:AmmeMemoRadiSam system protein B
LEARKDKVKRIFLLGPSHHEPFTGCALPSPSLTKYATPLGDIKLDSEVIETLAKAEKKRWLRLEKSVDEAEHSLEMHLPYIFHSMSGSDFTLVPIMVGSLSSGLEDVYGQLLAPYAEDDSNFFIVSSDFCHWGKRFSYTPFDSKNYSEIYKYITDLDRQGMDAVETGKVTEFRNYLSKTKNTICGRNPILVLLAIHSHSKTKFKTEFIHYAQSSQCADMEDSSVSYASAVVYGHSSL